jgi:ATP-dependent RNA helicase DDX5/DBP2
VTQEVKVVEEWDKKRALYEVLEKVMDGSKVLIFCSTKRTADELTASLRADGWPARAIHGDKSQAERDWVMAEFRSGRSPLMIATDVASRGLDVKDIKVSSEPWPATAAQRLQQASAAAHLLCCCHSLLCVSLC